MMSMKADAKIRTHDLVGNFTMGGIKCSHLIAGVDILETPDMDNNDTSLLSMTLYDVKKTSPDLETVHKSVLKRIDVKFKSVNLTIHQVAFIPRIQLTEMFQFLVFMLVKAHFFYARYFIPQWVYSWSTLVAGDEQPYWPRQQATQSMKVNIFCFSCECTIS